MKRGVAATLRREDRHGEKGGMVNMPTQKKRAREHRPERKGVRELPRDPPTKDAEPSQDREEDDLDWADLNDGEDFLYSP